MGYGIKELEWQVAGGDMITYIKPRITAVQVSMSYREMGEVSTDCTFVREMPVSVKNTHVGWLLYDVDTELFAGEHGWVEHERELIDCRHFYLPLVSDKDERGSRPRFHNQDVANALNAGDEVVLVPCRSFEAKVGDDWFVYQEFNWHEAIAVKSKSGALYGGTWGEY